MTYVNVQLAAAKFAAPCTITSGRLYRFRPALTHGLPATGRVLLVVGGRHPAVLRAAARHAGVLGLTGLGRTMPDGHHHEVRWSPWDLRSQLQLVREEGNLAGTTPII